MTILVPSFPLNIIEQVPLLTCLELCGPEAKDETKRTPACVRICISSAIEYEFAKERDAACLAVHGCSA